MELNQGARDQSEREKIITRFAAHSIVHLVPIRPTAEVRSPVHVLTFFAPLDRVVALHPEAISTDIFGLELTLPLGAQWRRDRTNPTQAMPPA